MMMLLMMNGGREKLLIANATHLAHNFFTTRSLALEQKANPRKLLCAKVWKEMANGKLIKSRREIDIVKICAEILWRRSRSDKIIK